MNSEYRYYASVGDVVLWRKRVWVIVDIKHSSVWPNLVSTSVGLIRGDTLGRFRWVRRVCEDRINELDLVLKAAYVPPHKVIERG